jgi:predicted ester cyclase
MRERGDIMPSEENQALVFGFLKACSAATEAHPDRSQDARNTTAQLERDIRSGFSQVLSADYIEHGPRSDMPLEELIKGMVWLRAAFPDLIYRVEDIIDGGAKVVVRYSARGTHLGQFMDAAPSNKEIEINGIYIARVAGGKIAEGWYASNIFSAEEIFEQLRLFLMTES